MIVMTPDNLDFRNRRVTVMGLGRFGGGIGAVRFFAARGARVTVTDLRSESELAESLARLDGLPLETVRFGEHREDDFRRADLVIASPAVPRDNVYLQCAREAGVPVTSEMSLFWRLKRGRVIGVTGSNGKSTTAALLHAMLRAAGFRCRLGGNIGRSLLPEVKEIAPDEWVVLELSSFQLEDLDGVPGPDVAVVTGFAPNHLDRHGSLTAYREAKQTILRLQSADGMAVLNGDDADVRGWRVNGRRLAFGLQDTGEPGLFHCDGRLLFRNGENEQTLPLPDCTKLPGEHNLRNVLAAGCAALAVGADVSAIQRGLEAFEPLPHRLQFVGDVNGRRFYNDSLATTPESAIAALHAFEEPVVLLAGGYDKGVDLSAMAEAIAQRTKAVILMGQTAGKLAALIDELDELDELDDVPRSQAPLGNAVCRSSASSAPKQSFDRGHCEAELRNEEPSRLVVHQCGSFEEAFGCAIDESAPGDVILLSPGCASYDWFRDFAERGERFTELVRRLEST